MFKDEDCIAISGLQHLVFCRRQWGLIHLDQEWEENQLTAEGSAMHERVDEGYREFRRGIRQYSGLYLKSLKFGIVGRSDLIELIKTNGPEVKITLLSLSGQWQIFPVEFKRGKAKNHDADAVQLCAQALCLEEMTGVSIDEGAVFYGKTKKRLVIEFDEKLRTKTKQIIDEAHELIATGQLPEARFGKHCRSCSLMEVCMPKRVNKRRLEEYRRELFGETS